MEHFLPPWRNKSTSIEKYIFNCRSVRINTIFKLLIFIFRKKFSKEKLTIYKIFATSKINERNNGHSFYIKIKSLRVIQWIDDYSFQSFSKYSVFSFSYRWLIVQGSICCNEETRYSWILCSYCLENRFDTSVRFNVSPFQFVV